jgi:hypothetical protein
MNRIYVGNLDPWMVTLELEDEFRVFGVLQRLVLSLRVWIPFDPFPMLCVCVHLYVREAEKHTSKVMSSGWL